MLPHPIILLVVQFSTTAFIIGFTSSNSFYRGAFLPLEVLSCAFCVAACKTALVRGPWAATVGGYSITYLFHYVVLALLSGWSYERNGLDPSTTPHHIVEGTHPEQEPVCTRLSALPQPFCLRLRFGLSAASSFRWTGTKREVRNVPHFSAKDQTYVPTKSTFLWQTAMKVLACYLIIDLMGLSNDEEMNRTYFHFTKVPFLTRLTEMSRGELTMRIGATIGAGLGIYCAQEGLQSILAFIAVGLGLSEARHWRPRFGSIADAYSIRRFWSVFWHQSNRLIISEPARCLLTDVLNLHAMHSTTKFISLGLVFLISGIIHLGIDISSGIPWQETGAIRFFCTQAFGIVLEESVYAMYRSSPLLQRLCEPRMSWVKTIGRAWVFAFMVWTVPGYMYPMMRRTRSGMQDSILPYSVLANLL